MKLDLMGWLNAESAVFSGTAPPGKPQNFFASGLHIHETDKEAQSDRKQSLNRLRQSVSAIAE